MNEENALLVRWRAGDSKAGEILAERYLADLMHFFEYKFPAEADELTAKTLLKWVESADNFRGEGSMRAYVFGIARHVYYEILKGRASAPQNVDLEVSSLDELVSSPSKEFGRRQVAAKLLEAMSKLSVEQNTLLRLHYWYGNDAEDLAAIYKASAGTIRTRLSRARDALRELLGGDAELEEALIRPPRD